ncbi:glycoside hydrolase family 30 protein [Labilibaculum antarcticum]|uniref:Glycosyl hydrolase family 30 TIM-barrel domain-containing protein n=1 Tax=Labilibaculum antarcticum TaxID=1717717 RepID=A0A1Y1CN93_9BACT|nr:glycoside hydrolase family 30 beta sandwich domain-containing protein [Labilibaculum antarcticum]BAX81744.1 hypothetical protein ALGA_3446 [Labilibaculum antarcticum]
MRILKTIAIALLLFPNSINAQQKLDVKLWAVQLEQGKASPLYEVKTDASIDKVEWKNHIFIQPEVTFQKIEGIGGAFNEIGGQALLSLNKEQQQEVMHHLFSNDDAGFTFCRTAIGASDFGLDAYSYSELADDYKMEHFSIDRDNKYVLPYIKSALEVNPNLSLFASPWSPPGWMKESGEMEGLRGKPNKLINEPKVYKAYAKYFVKYLQEYEDQGVRINRICIQNENDADTKYPSCVFPAKEMLSFANNYLFPAFEKNKITTKVYAGTFRAVNKMDLLDFAKCQNTQKIEGVGIQYTDSRFIADAKALQPKLKIFHTEGHCYNGENSAEQAMHRLEEVAGYINSGSTTFTYWNMILNETTKSGWDWPQNSLININRETGDVQYNPDFNAMYIISRFIKPGDVRIASVTRGKYPMISVKSPDGSIKVVIQNTNTEEKTFEILIENQEVKVNIPANTITAVVIKEE